MSPQLAISSAFSVFAMAALCVLGVSSSNSLPRGEAPIALQAEMPSLPSLSSDLLR
ncbi:MAG: hypothetical protein AAGL68_03525 [Pseudomonadota bacterium]